MPIGICKICGEDCGGNRMLGRHMQAAHPDKFVPAPQKQSGDDGIRVLDSTQEAPPKPKPNIYTVEKRKIYFLVFYGYV